MILIIVRVFCLLGLFLSAVWYFQEQGAEPIITAVGLVITLLLTFVSKTVGRSKGEINVKQRGGEGSKNKQTVIIGKDK